MIDIFSPRLGAFRHRRAVPALSREPGRSIVKLSHLALAAAAALALQAPAGAAVTYQFSLQNVDEKPSYSFDAVFTYVSPGFVAYGTTVTPPVLTCVSHSSTTCSFLGFLNGYVPERGPPLTGDVLDYSSSDTGGRIAYAPGTFVAPGIYTQSVGGNDTTLTISGSPAAAVPEPAAWALMIVGFGLTGTALRRRRVPARALTA